MTVTGVGISEGLAGQTSPDTRSHNANKGVDRIGELHVFSSSAKYPVRNVSTLLLTISIHKTYAVDASGRRARPDSRDRPRVEGAERIGR